MVPVQEDRDEEEVGIGEGVKQTTRDSLKKPKAQGTVDSVLDDTVVKQTTYDAEDDNGMLKPFSAKNEADIEVGSGDIKTEIEMVNIMKQDSE